jgi:hypothetical protein
VFLQCAETCTSLTVPYFNGLVRTASKALAQGGKRDDIFDPAEMTFEFDRRHKLESIIKIDDRSSRVVRRQQQTTITCEANVCDDERVPLECGYVSCRQPIANSYRSVTIFDGENVGAAKMKSNARNFS